MDDNYPWDAFWFVEKYFDKLDRKSLSGNKGITPEFFEKYFEKGYDFDWEGISRNEGMTPEFFERHLDKVHWREISRNKAIVEPLYNYVKWC